MSLFSLGYAAFAVTPLPTRQGLTGRQGTLYKKGKYNELHSQNNYLHTRYKHHERLFLYDAGEQAI
ncbi:hypothetical protein D3C87_2107250 [compost metagenome]